MLYDRSVTSGGIGVIEIQGLIWQSPKTLVSAGTRFEIRCSRGSSRGLEATESVDG